MLLKSDNPKASDIIVLLNDKPVKHYLAAEDIEGWIEILDISSISPLNVLETKVIDKNGIKKIVPSLLENQFTPGSQDQELEKSSIKTKKIYGKVEFKNISH